MSGNREKEYEYTCPHCSGGVVYIGEHHEQYSEEWWDYETWNKYKCTDCGEIFIGEHELDC